MVKSLPTFYYLEHLQEFFNCIQRQYAALLSEEHHCWLRRFTELSHDAQCLIARAANRKHPLIAIDSLFYAEINEVPYHLQELTHQHWFQPVNAHQCAKFLGLLTKPEIHQVISQFSTEQIPNATSKATLVARAKELSNNFDLSTASVFKRYLIRGFEQTLAYFLFIYFGHCKGRLNQFSLRDLGLMRTRKDSSESGARFDSREEAESAFWYAQWRDSLADKLQPVCLTSLPKARGSLANHFRDEGLLMLGKGMLNESIDYAMQALALSDAPAATEKWLREQYKQGHKEQVRAELEALIDEPPNDELLIFCQDFLARKYQKKKTSRLTDMLQSAQQHLRIDEQYINNVETGVIAHYRRKGLIAERTENSLWLTLFGLLFWDIIFEHDNKTLVNEFDIRPNVLTENRLYRDYSEQVERRLTQFSDTDQLLHYLLKVSSLHYGKVNSLFRWRKNLLDNIKLLLEHSTAAQWQTLLVMMAKDFSSLRDGYPDIMVIEGGQLRFEEIKARGDQLRRNQLVSLDKLRQAGFNVNITTVEWFRDPMQPYAVVDIETTGGRSGSHRITEVGIVKMVNGEKVDEWQSLINPQRHIPGHITRLTGISNDMVSTAPPFEAVADELDAFTQGCIFVAHNVNFDYGFFKAEYERLNRRFRRPKRCTCREMRRTHPGLRSYSLANLTEHFGISMTRHHRALSDAEAAAQLLIRIHAADEQSETGNKP